MEEMSSPPGIPTTSPRFLPSSDHYYELKPLPLTVGQTFFEALAGCTGATYERLDGMSDKEWAKAQAAKIRNELRYQTARALFRAANTPTGGHSRAGAGAGAGTGAGTGAGVKTPPPAQGTVTVEDIRELLSSAWTITSPLVLTTALRQMAALLNR